MAIDDFLKQVEEDELEDKVKLFPYIGVSDYARIHGMAPQQIYYYIRRGRLAKVSCECCGRGVISREEADDLFGHKEETEEDG